MSIKIAPAPPPINAPSLPRIAFLPNQQPVLLIPNNYKGNVSLPLRVSPNNERSQIQFIQPRPPSMTHDEVVRGYREEAGIAENLPSTQQRREFLKRKIQERPSKQYLIRKHILLTDPLVEPFVGEKTHQLRKQAVVSNLNRKLKSRPGPLDLVTKKILQADAELEEAIKEGRLLFPSSRREIESPSPSTPQAPSPSVLLSSLRISKQESIREEEESRVSFASHSDQGIMEGEEPEDQVRARKYNRLEASISRINPHPYARMEPQQPTLTKGRLKGPDSKSGAEYTAIPDNYEAIMKQQELFIEWRPRPDTVEGGLQNHPQSLPPQEDGGESDSGETIPYGEEEETSTTTTITYRVYPEEPQEAPDSTMITRSRSAPRASNQPNCHAPIFSLADLKKTDLMQECRLRGIKCGGDKTSIILRLEGMKEEIVAKFKEEQARLDATMESSPQISSERALSNTSSSSSPSTIMEDMTFDGVNGGIIRLDESIASRRHSLPSNNPQQGIAKSLQQPSRHLSMSSAAHPPLSISPTIGSLSFSQTQTNGPIERKIQMKTANGEIFYATLPSTDDLPIPRDGKPIGCRIAVVEGRPVLQFQQPNGPIEPGTVGPAGISDTLLFAQNGSGGQVTLGPQKERSRSNSLHRKSSYPGEVNSISSLLRSNSATTSLPVTIQRAPRTQSTSSTTTRAKTLLSLPREPSRKSSKAPQETLPPPPPSQPPRETAVQPSEDVEVTEVTESNIQEMTDAEQVLAHVQAINKLLDRPTKITVDAKTVLEHEQALRGQQRLIDQLQKELKKSYTALKMQQHLILSAKKAQTAKITKMTNSKLKSIGEAWLFELNMKRLHKSNNSFFLTHEQQEAELKSMTEEQKKVQNAHINIQMSEACDSAIKDITKFIGANPKTALLIVQLLKKYQNEKSQAAAAPTQTFADVSAFEQSEKTPNANRPQADPAVILDYAMVAGPSGAGTSTSTERDVQEGNGNGDEQEAIVIDDDSHDEDATRQQQPQQPQQPPPPPPQEAKIKLAAPPVRNRRKVQKGGLSEIDMEAIFKVVLDGSKTGKRSVQQVIVQHASSIDVTMNKTNDQSPTHSISSIPSSNSMVGVGPSDSSSSPSSSSTPPEMTVQQALRQPMHYANNQHLFSVHTVAGPSSMEYHPSTSSTLPPQSYESISSRPYVRDEIIDDNTTDILMEAVESSGIVDDVVVGAGGDEPMPSSSHSMHHMGHDNALLHDPQMIMLHEDSVHLMPTEHQEMLENHEQGTMDGTAYEHMGDIFHDSSPYNDFEFAFADNLNEYNPLDHDFNDAFDVIKNDDHEKPSPESKKVSYNGTQELNEVLGNDWMNMHVPMMHEHHIHPMQLDIPTESNNPGDNGAFEDVFPSSSHVGNSQSTFSLLPHSPPLITDMSWLNEDAIQNAFDISSDL